MERTTGQKVLIVVDYMLQFMVLFFCMAMIFITIFKWDRRDIFIQSLVWNIFMGVVLMLAMTLYDDMDGEDIQVLQDSLFYNSAMLFIFAAHLILVLKYLHTSLVIPDMISETKFTIERKQSTNVSHKSTDNISDAIKQEIKF